jgi:hypothetical protein
VDKERNRLTAGVDCSSFVVQAWGLDLKKRRYTTSDITSAKGPACVLEKIRSFNVLHAGDALIFPGRHVRLFLGQENPDGASSVIRVLEVTARCSGSCTSRYEVDQFEGYLPIRYRGFGLCTTSDAIAR